MEYSEDKGFMINRRKFLMTGAAFSAANSLLANTTAEVVEDRGILVRFLGSGASGWNPALAKHKYARRQSSVLIENKIVIDFTMCGFDHLPKGLIPKALFVTHSHGDHFNAPAVVKLGVKKVYTHSSWSKHAKTVLDEAANAAKLPAPEVIGIDFASPVDIDGIKLTAVPSIHSTSRLVDGQMERTAMYLVEKGESRLLYATDTAGIPGDAARMIGIDKHISINKYDSKPTLKENPFVQRPKPLTAFIMEATNGDNDEDFRLFVHASVQTVDRIVKMLKNTGRFTPPPGQRAYITHLCIKYRNWSPKKIEADISPELAAAYDGLEIRLG
jgi:phosphoribosyl 1,2-cyclic phosphodiesterase